MYGHSASVNKLCFSAEGHNLVTASDDYKIKVCCLGFYIMPFLMDIFGTSDDPDLTHGGAGSTFVQSRAPKEVPVYSWAHLGHRVRECLKA